MITRKIFLVIYFLLIVSLVSSFNYYTTAKSISWYGAYTSIAGGLEAMLYNPAGIYMSNHRFAFNIGGSYSIRLYNNSFTSDMIIDFIALSKEGKNLTKYGWTDRILSYIPETGVETGGNISTVLLMTFLRFSNFSFGIGAYQRTTFSFLVDKQLFVTFFKELDLTKTNKYFFRFYLLNYTDITFSLSCRVRFLENKIPIEGIYAGITAHLYFPVLLVKSNGTNIIKPVLNSESGFYDNYIFRIKGNSSIVSNPLANYLFFYTMTSLDATLKNYDNKKTTEDVYDYFNTFYKRASLLIGESGSFPFGIGFDAGFILKFNKIIKAGFSVTDLGFIVLPAPRVFNYDVKVDLNALSLGEFDKNLIDRIVNELDDKDNYSIGETEIISAPTAIRIGAALTPFKGDILTIAADVSLSNLHQISLIGYPSFSFSIGLEFLPGYKWFYVPLRTSFNYNTQANYPTFAFGCGLYFGPVEMEFGIKGLEFLIKDLGAKEVVVGADFKFEF